MQFLKVTVGVLETAVGRDILSRNNREQLRSIILRIEMNFKALHNLHKKVDIMFSIALLLG